MRTVWDFSINRIVVVEATTYQDLNTEEMIASIFMYQIHSGQHLPEIVWAPDAKEEEWGLDWTRSVDISDHVYGHFNYNRYAASR